MTKKTKDFSLPIMTCPHCSGNAYPTSVELVCEKCKESYSINISIFSDNVKLMQFSSENTDKYLKYILQQKYGDCDVNENNIQIFSVSFKGQILDIIKRIKNDYELTSLLLTVKYMMEGFVFILNQINNMSGNNVYLVDDLGNKSEELKRAFLRNAYESFNAEQDRLIVDNLLLSLGFKPYLDSILENKNDDTKKNSKDN